MMVIGGTLTSEGFIKYLERDGFAYPVRLSIDQKAKVAELKTAQPPLRDVLGRLLYATPGGGTTRAE